MPAQYRKNHTASVCYLEGFQATNGCVQVEYLRSGRRAPARPTAIGYINNFWGVDERLRKAAEERASEIEAAASPVLSRLPEQWPLEHESKDRLAILRFVALHLVRSPRWRAQLDVLAERSIATRRAEWKEALAESFGQFVERLRADGFMVDLMLGQVQTMSSLLGSLHWTLLRFPRPMLATSDQPVVPIPLLAPRAVVPIRPHLTNLVGNIEFRVAIDPQHALLMCWHDAEDAKVPVDLAFQEAIDLNAAVRAHAHAQVYWQPESRPPWIAPPEAQPTSRPISTAIYDGYSTAAAIRSRRMRETREILEEMIEDQVHNEVRTIKVVEQKRAA